MGNLIGTRNSIISQLECQAIDRNTLRANIKESYLDKFYFKSDGRAADLRFDYINKRMNERHLNVLSSEIEKIKGSISNTFDLHHLERLAFQRDTLMVFKCN